MAAFSASHVFACLPGKGLFSERMAGPQLQWLELVFMPEEAGEPRAGTKGNADQQSTHRTQSRKCVTQALSRVRQAASQRFAVKHPR